MEHVCVKGKKPLDIQQKGITPTNTSFRAATGIVTIYIVVVWAWLTILLCILQESTQSQHIFITVTGSPAIIGSFWTVTYFEPGLSSKYGYMPLTSQCLQVFFTNEVVRN